MTELGSKELADIQLISEQLLSDGGHLQLYQTLFAFAVRPYSADEGSVSGIDAPVADTKGFSSCPHGRQRNKCRECERLSKERDECDESIGQNPVAAPIVVSPVPRQQSCVAVNCQPTLTDRYEQLLTQRLVLVEAAANKGPVRAVAHKGGRSWGHPDQLGGVVAHVQPATQNEEAASVSALQHLCSRVGFSRCAAQLYPTEWEADSIQVCIAHLLSSETALLAAGQTVRMQVYPKSLWEPLRDALESAGVLLAPTRFELLVVVHAASSAVRYAVHKPSVWATMQCGDQNSKASRAQHRTHEALQTAGASLSHQSLVRVFESSCEPGGWTVPSKSSGDVEVQQMFALYVCDVHHPGPELAAIVAEIVPHLLPGGFVVLTMKLQNRCSIRGQVQLEQECREILGEAFEHLQVKFLLGNSLTERTLIAQQIGSVEGVSWEVDTFVARPILDPRDLQDLQLSDRDD